MVSPLSPKADLVQPKLWTLLSHSAGPILSHFKKGWLFADPNKVQALAESISEIGLQVPVCIFGTDNLGPLVQSRMSSSCFARHPISPRRYDIWVRYMQIDVLEVEGQLYGFSGCHRYEVSLSAALGSADVALRFKGWDIL